jgi:predicted dehydrogenase/threonine dehydrogenase-like Zn-dependent dehydrogenase
VKQILQSLKDGQTRIAEVPAVRVAAGHLLIRTTTSLVSAGTERMMVEFGKANWLDKARQQPDKVRMVLDKIRTDGLLPTLEAVRSKLDQPLAPGYCNVGVVVEVGAGVSGFSVGDRVASNGKHAEFVCVPKNLCAHIADSVSDEHAAFTVLAAIGLQGTRLLNPSLGECVVVTGLGLIGLLSVQILRAQGCRVLGIDFDPARLALARSFGAEVVDPGQGGDVLSAAAAFSRGRGVDAVLITASTRSNEPVSQAAQMCRQRGRIVLVGVTGLELSRADFYEKELSFQVSCSYGPGRYDSDYELHGHDYPIGFVRWTEQRNFEAVLDLMAGAKLELDALISHRFDLDQAVEAYELLAGKQASLGILLNYPGNAASGSELPDQASMAPSHAGQPQVQSANPANASATFAFVGAGNYAGRVLIPAFHGAGARLHAIVSNAGVSAAHYAGKYGFSNVSTDAHAAISDAPVDCVVVATRHDSHAGHVLTALKAGKHVFCEKPLCLTLEQLGEIENALANTATTQGSAPDRRSRPLLMVGFNRRFAPQAVRMKSLLGTLQDRKSFIMTVNAGAIPADHWTQDPALGGGRIVGECCHFIDLLRFLAGSPIKRWSATALGRAPGASSPADTVTVSLEFADGSIGSIHYLANGEKGFPKERLEVFCAGRILQLDNFRKLHGWGWKGFSSMNLWRQDKGQQACAQAFVDAVRNGGPAPIDWQEIAEVSRVSIECQAMVG